MLRMYDVAVIGPHFKNLETLHIYEATEGGNQPSEVCHPRCVFKL